jgi:pimeloyl-ACP methyl ester carboxylesterase
MSQKIIKIIGKTLNTLSVVAPKYASTKALNLFATPRKGRYTQKQRNVIDDSVVETLTYQGLNIQTYRWNGRNKTILLAHGWESNASRWDYLLDALKTEDYNIIALDGPAHGDSSGKQFNALLYSQCINLVAQHFKPEVLIGHSVGGMASIFALYNNDMPFVKKLISLGAPAHFTGVFLRYKKMMGYNHKISKGLDRIVIERFNNPVDYFSAANFTASFDIEGLIIHDKRDLIIPYEDALLFKSKFKNSELITTKGFGHGLKDQSLTSKIIGFINS